MKIRNLIKILFIALIFFPAAQGMDKTTRQLMRKHPLATMAFLIASGIKWAYDEEYRLNLKGKELERAYWGTVYDPALHAQERFNRVLAMASNLQAPTRIWILQELMDQDFDVVNAHRTDIIAEGDNALRCAISCHSLQLITWLLDNGADINKNTHKAVKGERDVENYHAPLFSAMRDNHHFAIDTCTELLARGANPTVSFLDYRGPVNALSFARRSTNLYDPTTNSYQSPALLKLLLVGGVPFEQEQKKARAHRESPEIEEDEEDNDKNHYHQNSNIVKLMQNPAEFLASDEAQKIRQDLFNRWEGHNNRHQLRRFSIAAPLESNKLQSVGVYNWMSPLTALVYAYDGCPEIPRPRCLENFVPTGAVTTPLQLASAGPGPDRLAAANTREEKKDQ